MEKQLTEKVDIYYNSNEVLTEEQRYVIISIESKISSNVNKIEKSIKKLEHIVIKLSVGVEELHNALSSSNLQEAINGAT